MSAALDAKMKRTKGPEHIEALGGMIEPALKHLDAKLTGAAQLNAAVEANVRGSMAQIADNPNAKRALEEKRFEMVGIVYQLARGRCGFWHRHWVTELGPCSSQ